MIIQTNVTIILDITKPADKKLADRLKEQGQLKYSYLGNAMCSFEINNEIEKDASEYVKVDSEPDFGVVGQVGNMADYDDLVPLKRVIDIIKKVNIKDY